MLQYTNGMFSKQEDGVDITANSVHPGAIVTNIIRHNSLFRSMNTILHGESFFFFSLLDLARIYNFDCFGLYEEAQLVNLLPRI